jgi:hypothetical protein
MATTDEPEWMQCTVQEWEKKGELAMQSGQMAKALYFADLANCRDMYDQGMDIENIQNRFSPDEDVEYEVSE